MLLKGKTTLYNIEKISRNVRKYKRQEFPIDVRLEDDDMLYISNNATCKMERIIDGKYEYTLKKEIKKLAIDGLVTQEGHHKQWYIEKILKVLGYNLDDVRQEAYKEGYVWEDGIPP